MNTFQKLHRIYKKIENGINLESTRFSNPKMFIDHISDEERLSVILKIFDYNENAHKAIRVNFNVVKMNSDNEVIKELVEALNYEIEKITFSQV